jgi:hypothetical protein
VAEEIDTETVVDLSEIREPLAEEQEEDNDPHSDVNHKK